MSRTHTVYVHFMIWLQPQWMKSNDNFIKKL